MSSVTITVYADSVGVEGVDGGDASYELEGGAWHAALTDDTGTVRVLAIANDDTEPTVRYYTDNGQTEFPEAWKFTDDEPASITVVTVDEARIVESSTDRRRITA